MTFVTNVLQRHYFVFKDKEEFPSPASTSNMEILKLDIYALTDEKIQACKTELDKKLGKALKTTSWSDKESYLEDKRHIANLSTSQVCATRCH